MEKLFRITTVPLSLEKLLEGQLNYMQQYYKVTAISADSKRLSELGAEIGVKTYPVEMTREITPGKDLQGVWQLYRYFRQERPLIVHTHTPKAGVVGMTAAKLAGVPIRLHTVAGLPLLESKGATRRILESVEKLTYSCATKVYPNSQKIFEFLVNNRFGPRSKFKVIGSGSTNGIDTTYFDPNLYSKSKKAAFKKVWNIPGDDLVFIFIGRLVGDKGINELIEAFDQLNKSYPATTLLLVGPFEQELDPIKEENLNKITRHSKIIETGYQDDVRPFLSVADVLTFPSYREGFPNVVMQAGAMELPSIVTDINGCNEIIEEGQNGLIIPLKSTSALYRAMEKMVTDGSLRKTLSKKARPMIVSKYERQGIWEAILKEYRELEKVNGKIVPQTT